MNAPASRTSGQLILEGIVTTKCPDGSTNIAPMGPVADRTMDALRLRPFQTSTTYQNLVRERHGIFHVTDNVEMLAAAAIGQLETPSFQPYGKFDGQIIADACRWYAFEVAELDDSNDRAEIQCRVIDRGDVRPFFGWNRAMHAVLEAAILATRVGMLSVKEIQAQLSPLATIIEKTASDRERRAFEMIRVFVENQS